MDGKTEKKMDGVMLIAHERTRQVESEDFDAAHDSHHDRGQLAWGAACYAAPSQVYRVAEDGTNLVDPWPWDEEWWKPGESTVEGRIRALAKAGALCAAEIDRLKRTQ